MKEVKGPPGSRSDASMQNRKRESVTSRIIRVLVKRESTRWLQSLSTEWEFGNKQTNTPKHTR